MGNANEGSSMTQISAAARGNPAPVTQIDHARAGAVTAAMRIVAEKEGRDPEFIRGGRGGRAHRHPREHPPCEPVARGRGRRPAHEGERELG